MRKRRHGCVRAHLLQNCKELRAAVGADAEILGQAGRMQGEALGAAARRLQSVGMKELCRAIGKVNAGKWADCRIPDAPDWRESGAFVRGRSRDKRADRIPCVAITITAQNKEKRLGLQQRTK